MAEWFAAQPNWLVTVLIIVLFGAGFMLGRLTKKSIYLGPVSKSLRRIADALERNQ